MNIVHVVGARPNFVKTAPVMRALSRHGAMRQVLVHTGQHYDAGMSGVFFAELGMPQPDINLGVGSGSHARQTAAIMTAFEDFISSHKPDLVLVYGDVNSTIAAALVCAKLGIRIGHVEAGLRSFDRGMPEEINRVLTDQVSDLLFTPSQDGNVNLLREGVAAEKIHLVGNVMIDTLVRLLPKAAAEDAGDFPERFALVTLHRPSNVDDPGQLKSILAALESISGDLQIIFPVHPRTRQRIADMGFQARNGHLRLFAPMPYLRFLALERRAAVVVTDSGGIQEETTYLGVPCLTLRENTERPVTVAVGTNIVVGRDLRRLCDEVQQILQGKRKQGAVPALWDGHAAERISDVIASSA
jgi:UDP-N-acetylglucosamine 2-epimerase (non-hydrolysing)